MKKSNQTKKVILSMFYHLKIWTVFVRTNSVKEICSSRENRRNSQKKPLIEVNLPSTKYKLISLKFSIIFKKISYILIKVRFWLIDRILMILMTISKFSQEIKFNNTLKKFSKYNKIYKIKVISQIIISCRILKKAVATKKIFIKK